MSGDVTKHAAPWLKVARRVAIVVLLLCAAVALLGGPPIVCQDAVAGASSVRLCGPMAIGDVRVVLFAVVLAVLLLGEVSELQIGGVVTVKARVAEAKAAAAEAERTLAEVRLVTHLSSSSAATATTNVFVGDRTEATADALDRVRRGEPPARGVSAEPPTAAPGAFAVAAFGAGFLGLRSVLPEWAAEAAVIGYTLTAEGGLALHAASHATDHDIAACTEHVADLARALFDAGDGRWLAAVEATDDAGSRIGALGVLVTPPSTATARKKEFAAAVDVAGAVYSRLLVDLLGERHAPEPGAAAVRGAI